MVEVGSVEVDGEVAGDQLLPVEGVEAQVQQVWHLCTAAVQPHLFAFGLALPICKRKTW